MRTATRFTLLLVGLLFINPLNAQQKKPAAPPQLVIPDSCLVTGKYDTLEIQSRSFLETDNPISTSVFHIGKREIVTQILSEHKYDILGVQVGYGNSEPDEEVIHRYVRIKERCKKLREDIAAELHRQDKTVKFSW